MIQFNEFWPLQLLFKDLGVHRDSNSEHGSSLGSVRVISITLFALPRAWNMIPGLLSWPALLQALALVASPRVATMGIYFQFKVKMLYTNLVIWVPCQCHLGCYSLYISSLLFSIFFTYIILPFFILEIKLQERPICNGPIPNYHLPIFFHVLLVKRNVKNNSTLSSQDGILHIWGQL
jgi:hypothetical protein